MPFLLRARVKHTALASERTLNKGIERCCKRWACKRLAQVVEDPIMIGCVSGCHVGSMQKHRAAYLPTLTVSKRARGVCRTRNTMPEKPSASADDGTELSTVASLPGFSVCVARQVGDCAIFQRLAAALVPGKASQVCCSVASAGGCNKCPQPTARLRLL